MQMWDTSRIQLTNLFCLCLNETLTLPGRIIFSKYIEYLILVYEIETIHRLHHSIWNISNLLPCSVFYKAKKYNLNLPSPRFEIFV